MKRQSLVAKPARKFEYTSDSEHKFRVATNLLDQDFNAIAPNQKWAGDITYQATAKVGCIYLLSSTYTHGKSLVGQ